MGERLKHWFMFYDTKYKEDNECYRWKTYFYGKDLAHAIKTAKKYAKDHNLIYVEFLGIGTRYGNSYSKIGAK